MVVRGRDRFAKATRVFAFAARLCNLFPSSWRAKLLRLSRRIGGIFGISIRYVLLKSVAKNCGENVSIHPDVFLFQPSALSVGNNVSIHPMCYLDATGGITIGSDVSIAHGCTIMSTEHKFGDTSLPIKDQGVKSVNTTICEDVWIGAKATILAGSRIGAHSIVAAGAVVTKDVPESVVVAGIPARIISRR